MNYLEQLMLVASAISLCPDIYGLCSIGVQRKLPWQRTSDDERGARDSMGVLPASGMDKHAACGMDRSPPASRQVATCQPNGQVSLNAEAAHRLSAGWIGSTPYP